jgi:uncharacterized protein
MAPRSALELITKSSATSLLLRCHVRPGVAKTREGIISVTEESIELCIAAPPQDGRANKAVVDILSEVSEERPLLAQSDPTTGQRGT